MKLCTFSERKPSLVLKCLHKKLKWSKQMGKPIDIVAEQYIQLPLAIADADGSPLKGQKNYTTKVYETRYKESSPTVIPNNLPQGWIPQCCIVEGMFLINTTPLESHRTFSDYARFLITRFISLLEEPRKYISFLITLIGSLKHQSILKE